MTWQWRDGTTWRDFDPGLASQLESAREAGQATCVYSFRGQPYEVDFQQNTQVNLGTGFARDVRRLATSYLAVGARVEARFEGKATYYAGKITEVTGSTYSIAYDDGDRETDVAEDLIRVYTEPKKEDDYSEDDVEEESIAESVGSTASFDASEPSRHQSDSDSDEAYAFD